MSPITSAALVGGVVAAGQVSQGKGITAKFVLGGMFYAVAIVTLNSAAPQVAGPLASLVLVAAIFTYVPSIAKGIGVIPS